MSDSTDMRGLFSDARAEAESAPYHERIREIELGPPPDPMDVLRNPPRLQPPDVFNEGDRKTDPPSAEFEARRVASSRPPLGECDHGPALPWRSSVEMATEREKVLAYDFSDDRRLVLETMLMAEGIDPDSRFREVLLADISRAEVEPWRVAMDMMLLRSEP